MQAKAVDLLESFSGFNVMRVPLHLYLAGHLEMVFLLADECVIYLGVIEAFVGTHDVSGSFSMN